MNQPRNSCSTRGVTVNLQERLMADLKEALRSNDVPRKDAIRMIRAAVKNAEIEWQREATDEEIQGIISREIKHRQEALELFRKGGREDLVAAEEAGIAILERYLPEQLSREQVAEVIRRIVAEMGVAGPGTLGPVMRQAMAQLKGKAEGRLVNEVAREILSK
jgi:uncharacterized protein YqeY